MGSTAVHPEVAGLRRVGVDAVDPENKLIGQGVDSIGMALASCWRRQRFAIDFAALVDSSRNEAFPLGPTGHALWVGHQNKQQLGGGGDCPDRVTGELRVGGRGIARGYRGSPNPTADRFVEHDGRVSYRTDLTAAAGAMRSVAAHRDCRRGRDRPHRALRPGGDGSRCGHQR